MKPLTLEENKERAKKVISLEKKGLSYSKIAKEIGLSYSQLMHWRAYHQELLDEYEIPLTELSKNRKRIKKRKSLRYMTDDDIRKSYRNAINPEEQVYIIAQLNAMRVSEVKKILGIHK